VPPYKEFLLPVLHAVRELGGSAHAKEISTWMVENLGFDDNTVAVEYPNRPGESVLLDRMAWARSYDKLGGLVETPQRMRFDCLPGIGCHGAPHTRRRRKCHPCLTAVRPPERSGANALQASPLRKVRDGHAARPPTLGDGALRRLRYEP
jgi:hypothetical protein